ncbi:MAG: DMT family transporter [Pseudomonadota bacterium]
MTRSMYLALLGIGAVWGLTIPLIKIAATAGHHPFALVFWQLAIAMVVLAVILLATRQGLGFSRKHLPFYLLIAGLGTLVPNSFSFASAAHLPAGILAMNIAWVPMFAMPFALLLGLEKPEARRFAGLGLGAIAVIMILAPDAALPAGIAAIWIFVALASPLCYGLEGNLVAKIGTRGLTPIQVIFGSSVVGTIIAFPFAATGERWVNLAELPPGTWAILGNGVLHGVAYSGYIFLVGRAGPVFSSQVAYVVTGFGVFWSMVILGERYSLWVWAAFLVLFLGLTLVQPRPTVADRKLA